MNIFGRYCKRANQSPSIEERTIVWMILDTYQIHTEIIADFSNLKRIISCVSSGGYIDTKKEAQVEFFYWKKPLAV
jgi:hypothetical protein